MDWADWADVEDTDLLLFNLNGHECKQQDVMCDSWMVLYLLEVEVVFRGEQLELLPVLLWSSQQQVVEHVVVPGKNNTQHELHTNCT